MGKPDQNFLSLERERTQITKWTWFCWKENYFKKTNNLILRWKYLDCSMLDAIQFVYFFFKNKRMGEVTHLWKPVIISNFERFPYTSMALWRTCPRREWPSSLNMEITLCLTGSFKNTFYPLTHHLETKSLRASSAYWALLCTWNPQGYP